ncbi:response regulator [bacterium]|nr:response regulator [bacterium]
MTAKKILIIEDNQDIRENISEILELDGYETLQASNGKEGARMAIDSLPDLVLCDIMMPELDGYGVLHILSKNESTVNIPFIFLTAKAEKSDLRKGMNLGADDYITKPFDETDLLNAINNRLNKVQRRNSIATPAELHKDIFKNKVVKHFAAKDIVYREDDSALYAYYLKSGKVKITKMNRDGKEIVVDLCSDEDYFGYWPLLNNSDHSNTAECLEDCEIWFIPAENFSEMLATDSEWTSIFIKLLASNLLIKEHKILDLAYESVRKRIAKSLLELRATYKENDPVKIKVSRETLASMAGTSVETAIRMLSEFKSDGLIDVHGSEIKILDHKKLGSMPY